ncbi:NnrS family protein [Arhodomonas aquaeolei]|uniref:NnrS family protein n=1 Tax=Arhodomonas aquaeolei TaxID=2369 RepID=UPI000377A268|nr:NnrS family protein [Arhodomonas aquaeolei]
MARPAAPNLDPQTVFFPLAAVYAAVSVPVSVFAMAYGSWPPLLGSPAAHGLELLIGYFLAVIAGFLLPAGPGTAGTAALAGLWLAGRVAAWGWPQPAMALNAAFAVAIALMTAPRFLGGLRRWHSTLFGLTLLATGGTLATAALADGVLPPAWQPSTLVEAALLASTVVVFLGGRVVAPATGGAWPTAERTGMAAVQPATEAVILLGITAGAVLLPYHAPSAAVPVAAAGAAALWRVFRWRPWTLRHQPDVQGLITAHAWTGAGLLGLAVAWVAAPLRAGTMLHVLLIGGLGTFGLHLMARIALQRARQGVAGIRLLPVATVLLAVATLAQFAPGLIPVAVGLWSLAFVLVARLLFNLSRERWRAAFATGWFRRL